MKARLFVFLAFFFLSYCALSEKKDSSATPKLTYKTAEELLGKIEEVYNGIDDVQMNFEQTVVQELFGKKAVSYGKIYSIRPGKLFWHTQKPSSNEEKLVISDQEQWLYQPSEKVVYYAHLSDEDFLAKLTLIFLKKKGTLQDYFKVQFLGKEKNLALYPKKEIPNIHRIELIYNKKTFLLEGFRVIYTLHKVSTVLFSDIKVNQELWKKHKSTPLDPLISQEDFRFKVPSDVKIQSFQSQE